MARAGRPRQPLVLEADERTQLERLAQRPKTEQRLALRSQIVFRCGEGFDSSVIASNVIAAALRVRPRKGRYEPLRVSCRLLG